MDGHTASKRRFLGEDEGILKVSFMFDSEEQVGNS